MQEASPRPLDVFLVADSEHVRRTLADRLGILPHIQICGEAESVAQALTVLTARRPELVGSGEARSELPVTVRVVLYAEDCDDDVYLMKRAFEKAKFDGALMVVENGEEAICYLAGEGRYSDRAAFPFPSLVLLDGRMPLVGGFGVLRWIRGRQSFNALPVVIFTSCTQSDDTALAFSAGADCVLGKPAKAEQFRELAEDLSKVCSGELRLSASSIRGAVSDPRSR